MIFNPALFQDKLSFGSATSYKDNIMWRPEMADVFQWMLSQSDDTTIVAASDARNPKIRFQLQKIVLERQKDELKHLENHIMYRASPRKDDLRFPSRKVYGAFSTLGTVVGVLPVSRVRLKTRARANFSACGETTTHTRSYSGVPWRSLSSLPRMTLNVKEGVTGITLPAFDDVVSKETKNRGHPLFWPETLDVVFFGTNPAHPGSSHRYRYERGSSVPV